MGVGFGGQKTLLDSEVDSGYADAIPLTLMRKDRS